MFLCYTFAGGCRCLTSVVACAQRLLQPADRPLKIGGALWQLGASSPGWWLPSCWRCRARYIRADTCDLL